MTVIDMCAERNKREEPNPEFVRHDDLGAPLYLFLLSYGMDGAKWGCEVWAYSMEDAAKRVGAMRESLTLDGQLYSRIPA